MKMTLLTLNKPNLNNRIYPKAVIEKAILKYKDNDRCIVESEPNITCSANLGNAIGKVTNMKIENDLLVGDVSFLFSGFENFSVRPNGYGTLQLLENGVQIIGDDYHLTSFSITNDPA